MTRRLSCDCLVGAGDQLVASQQRFLLYSSVTRKFLSRSRLSSLGDGGDGVPQLIQLISGMFKSPVCLLRCAVHLVFDSVLCAGQ